MHSLDTPAWQKIALSLEATLRKSATETSSEQQRLGLKIRQVSLKHCFLSFLFNFEIVLF